MSDEQPRWQFQPLEHPFRLALIGRSGAGKTSLIWELLASPDFYHGFFNQIYIFAPTAFNEVNHTWDRLGIPEKWRARRFHPLNFRALVEKVNSTAEIKRVLFILDDATAFKLREGGVTQHQNYFDEWITTIRHEPRKISIIISIHAFTALSMNAQTSLDGVVIFPSTNMTELEHVSRKYDIGKAIDIKRNMMDMARNGRGHFVYIHRMGQITDTVREQFWGPEITSEPMEATNRQAWQGDELEALQDPLGMAAFE